MLSGWDLNLHFKFWNAICNAVYSSIVFIEDPKYFFSGTAEIVIQWVYIAAFSALIFTPLITHFYLCKRLRDKFLKK